jgi:hypothetical protein
VLLVYGGVYGRDNSSNCDDNSTAPKPTVV